MSNEKEKILNGERHDPTDPGLVADRNRARDLTRQYNNTIPDDQTERQEIVEELFGSVGDEASNSVIDLLTLPIMITCVIQRDCSYLLPNL